MVKNRTATALRTGFITAIVMAALGILAPPSNAWGPQGHDLVTAKAIAALPAEIQPFYEHNERMIVALALMPDLWKDYHKAEEGPNHFIDLDLFASPPFFSEIPRDKKVAERKFGEDRLRKQGVLPWVIEWRYEKLVKAMRKKDPQAIVEQSAMLSHYVADAHVPFHATKDYDGKKPEQKGLHARFEIELLRRCVAQDDISVPQFEAPEKVLGGAFAWCEASYQQLDLLNMADEKARGTDRSYGEVYYAEFARTAKPIAVEQLEKGAAHLAGLYYSAWLDAGKPKLEPKAAPLLWKN